MNRKKFIDINADVGEGIGNERLLFPFLSSCNIACGGHVGDEDSVKKMVKLATEFKLKIGAHPSFPDKEHFGRNNIDISASALFKSLRTQVLLVLKAAKSIECRVHHIKPHGALYNLAAKDKQTASVIVEVIKSYNGTLKLYAPFGSVIAKLAESEGVDVIYEAFADRNYNEDGSLVSRKQTNALITDKKKIVEHVLQMVVTDSVTTVDGSKIPIKADTICVHGDTQNASAIVSFLNSQLINYGINIR